MLNCPRSKRKARSGLGNDSYAKTSQECKRKARSMIG